jgi:cytochrome c-type biogenesis protein
MSKKFFALILLAAALIGGAIVLGNSQGTTDFLWQVSGEGSWLLPLILIAALIDSVNPCAFSILLVTITFLFSIGKLRSGILKIGGAYVLGIFIVYMLIGLGVLQALHLFNTPHFMSKVGAFLLIAFGAINLINEFWPSFPVKLKIPASAHGKIGELMEKASIPTALALGALVGLCEFPCTGGPYLLVLGLLHDSATYASGLGYLVLYNLVFVLPLGVILLIASDQGLLMKVQAWKKQEIKGMRFWSGIAMVVLGLLIFTL